MTTTIQQRRRLTVTAALALLSLAATGVQFTSSAGAEREQSTELISRDMNGGIPNGPSTDAVISADRRYSRIIAYASAASDIVPGDRNGNWDVFAILRGGSYGNNGSPWRPGKTMLVSRGLGGAPANGPSFAPAVDGNFDHRGSCVAFLSAASNLVAGDTNGRVDAFLSRGPGKAPRRISLPSGRQSSTDTTAVDVSGDCRRAAFVTNGRLYVRTGKKTRKVSARGVEDPAFAEGRSDDLVFATPKGVFLARAGSYRPRRVARGRNPVYNNLKRQVVAYEHEVGGQVQVVFRDLGRGEKVASSYRGDVGNRASRNPVIGNSGYYVAFESDASNLGTTSTGRRYDENGDPDAYLYTDVRKLTLVQSVEEKGIPVPGGGMRPSMSYYANYIVFHAPAPLGSENGPPQIFMRYLGPV